MILAIIYGLIAACAWGVVNVMRAVAIRRVGHSLRVTAITITIELILFAIWAGWDLWQNKQHMIPDLSQMGLALAAALMTVIGVMATFKAVHYGKTALMIPIISANGLIAASLAVLAGHAVTVPLVLGGLMILLGMFCVTLLGEVHIDPEHVDRAGVIRWALVSFAALGTSNYLLAVLGGDASPSLALFWSRAIVFTVLALPLLFLQRGQHNNKEVGWLLAGTGILGAVAIGAYVLGTQVSIVITSLVATQYGAITALISMIWWHERIHKWQIVGLGLIATGIIGVVLGR